MQMMPPIQYSNYYEYTCDPLVNATPRVVFAGWEPDEQQLSYREQILEDSNTLEHYGIKRAARWHWKLLS